MAVLSDSDRFEIWAEYMRTNSESFTLSKADVRAALNAVDTFLSDNAAALNTAIPQPARGALSTPQKALLLTAVVRKRYLSGV
jgi:hypothetical protein